jgi:hypothetical protein
MHNKGNPSAIYVYDMNNFNIEGIIDGVGYLNHGLFVNNKSIYTLSTGTSELIEIDRNNFIMTSHKVASESLFLRGMAYLDNYIYFGCTNNRSMAFPYNFSFIRKYNILEGAVVNDLIMKDVKIIFDFQILLSTKRQINS